MSGYRLAFGHFRPFAIGLGACLVVAAGSVAVQQSAGAAETHRLVTPLGARVPDVMLRTLDGKRVSLRARLGGRPALLYIAGASDCAGCSSLPLDFKIVHGEAPGLQTLLIGSGATPAAFRTTATEMGAGTPMFIDENRALLHAFGVSTEPLVLLVDSTGQILLVDSRGASRAAEFPMGNILHSLGDVLRAAESRPRP